MWLAYLLRRICSFGPQVLVEQRPAARFRALTHLATVQRCAEEAKVLRGGSVDGAPGELAQRRGAIGLGVVGHEPR